LYIKLTVREFNSIQLGATYDVHLRLIGKRVINFLLLLNFLLGATTEALRANIDWKSANSLKRRPLTQNFR